MGELMNQEIQASMNRSKHISNEMFRSQPATLYSATLAGLVVEGDHLLHVGVLEQG